MAVDPSRENRPVAFDPGCHRHQVGRGTSKLRTCTSTYVPGSTPHSSISPSLMHIPRPYPVPTTHPPHLGADVDPRLPPDLLQRLGRHGL